MAASIVSSRRKRKREKRRKKVRLQVASEGCICIVSIMYEGGTRRSNRNERQERTRTEATATATEEMATAISSCFMPSRFGMRNIQIGQHAKLVGPLLTSHVSRARRSISHSDPLGARVIAGFGKFYLIAVLLSAELPENHPALVARACTKCIAPRARARHDNIRHLTICPIHHLRSISNSVFTFGAIFWKICITHTSNTLQKFHHSSLSLSISLALSVRSFFLVFVEQPRIRVNCVTSSFFHCSLTCPSNLFLSFISNCWRRSTTSIFYRFYRARASLRTYIMLYVQYTRRVTWISITGREGFSSFFHAAFVGIQSATVDFLSIYCPFRRPVDSIIPALDSAWYFNASAIYINSSKYKRVAHEPY